MTTDNILLNVKSMIGLAADYDAFDSEICVHVNSALLELSQLGVGPPEGISIGPTAEELWTDYIDSRPVIEMAKQYVYLKTKILFDPPSSSTVMTSLTEQIDRVEWRLNAQVDEAYKTDPEENK